MENERMDNIKGILEDIQNNKQGLVNFEGGNFNKNQGSGSVEVEETGVPLLKLRIVIYWFC